jgi:nucleoside-diphosphate-sugar epimerase
LSRVLLTGASGFVGSKVLEALLQRGHQVAVLRRDPASPRLQPFAGRFEAIAGDMERLDAWSGAAKAFAPEILIHAAWRGIHGAERQGPAQEAQVGEALELQRLSAAWGVKRFVSLGSQAEYGPLHAPADEQAPKHPDSGYGRAKIAIWQGLREQAPALGQRVLWVRLFSAYGPGDDERWVLPSVARALLAGRRPSLGPCTVRWDYVYGRDAAEALLLLLEQGAEGDYNLGSGEAPVLRSTLEALRDLIDPALPLGFGERAEAPGQSTRLQAVTAKLRAATGWAPRTPLAEGLRALVESLR